MVYESANNVATSYDIEPLARKSSFKAMDMQTYGANGSESTGTKPKKMKCKSCNNKTQDAWGPIYKNREHFINMHLC